MVPRRLPKRRERKRMSIHQPGVRLAGGGEVGVQVWSEQSVGGLHRFERPQPAEDLVTVLPVIRTGAISRALSLP